MNAQKGFANDAKDATATAAPPRNFTLTAAERANALVTGPPAYALRRRRIEDLRRAILLALGELSEDEETRLGSEGVVRPGIARAVFRLNALIDAHNRYYPVEANLPIDPHTGGLVERGGTPWRPMSKVTVALLLDELRTGNTGA